jgi:hypothetical protein
VHFRGHAGFPLNLHLISAALKVLQLFVFLHLFRLVMKKFLNSASPTLWANPLSILSYSPALSCDTCSRARCSAAAMRVSKTFSHPLLSSSSHCLHNSSHLRYWIRSLTVCLSFLHFAATRLKSCRNCLFSADTWHQFCCISDRSSMLFCASSSKYPTCAFKSVISSRCKYGGS